MIVSGKTTRTVPLSRNFSFLFEAQMTNMTGSGCLVFSGENNELVFSFKSGRIYDPQNRYVYSYTPEFPFSISGDINTGIYRYSIDDKLICNAGTKSNFRIENFYTHASGHSMDADLRLFSNIPNYSYVFTTTGFSTGATLTFDILNLSSGDSSFRIFSGEVLINNERTDVFKFQSGSFPTGVSTTRTLTINDVSAQESVIYPLDFKLYTDFGTISSGWSPECFITNIITSFNLINYNHSGSGYFETAPGDAENLKTGTTEQGYMFGNWLLHYKIYNMGTSTTPNQLFYVSLSGTSGNTGSYLGPYITGVTLTSSGVGYDSVPTISFAGGGGSGAAATAYINGGNVTGITVTSYGSGYTGTPTVSFAGGTPEVTATGTAVKSGYTKTFRNTWNLYTGTSVSGVVDFDVNNFTGLSGICYTGQSITTGDYSVIVIVRNQPWYDTDLSTCRLVVTGYGSSISTWNITGGRIA